MEEKSLASIIGENISKYRTLAGLTQSQLAEQVMVSTAFISRVERGQKMMKIQTLFLFSQALGVSFDALLSPDSPSTKLLNINHLLANQPDDFLDSMEALIRVCVDRFSAKTSTSRLQNERNEG